MPGQSKEFQVFANYIEQFERLNGEKHREYYKWQIARTFHDEMDAALNAPDAHIWGYNVNAVKFLV